MYSIKSIWNSDVYNRIFFTEPSGTVTFHRQVIAYKNLPNWYSSTRGIRTAIIKSHGLIEDDGHGLLQVSLHFKMFVYSGKLF